MTNYFTEKEALFGVTPSMAIDQTREMLKREAEQVEGITLKMKSYIQDTDNVLKILELQDEYSKTTHEGTLKQLENKLVLMRARIDN